MSIRPVDLQVAVPYSQEVSRINHNERAQGETMSRQFANQLEKEIQHERESVKQSSKSEQDAVDKDGSNKNGLAERERQRKKRKAAEAKPAARRQGDSMLDIKI